MKKKRKSPRQKAKLKCLDTIKKYAKERDGYVCQRCDKPVKGANAHGSHIIPVSRCGWLAVDPDNIKCLCYSCHFNFWHKDPLAANNWFKSKFPGRKEMLELKFIENQKKGKIPIEYYLELIEEYK